MWKSKVILEVVGKTNLAEDEINFIESSINGGKTDNAERANNICAYLETEGNEQLVYEKLEKFSALANER